MNRITALLLPMIVLVTSIPLSQGRADTDPAVLAKYWASSLQAESQKNYDEALKQLVSYQQEGGDGFLLAMRTGWLYYLKGAYPQAEQFYRMAATAQPAALNPMLGLLTVAQAGADPRKTQLAAEDVLRVDPLNYRANMVLGGVYLAGKSYAQSFSAYRRVLTSYPDDIDARSGAAWASFYMGQKAEAAKDFRTILTISPDYPHAQEGFGLASATAPGAGLLAPGLQSSALQPSAGLRPTGL